MARDIDSDDDDMEADASVLMKEELRRSACFISFGDFILTLPVAYSVLVSLNAKMN